MANNCVNCGCSKISCGCGDTFLTSPAPCPTPADCPQAQPCSEVFDAQCVVYTGTNLECDAYTIVTPNTSMADALVGIIDYMCTQFAATPEYVVEAVAGVTVDTETVGTVTTFSLTATNKLKFVKEISTNFDSASIGISQSELNACRMNPTICSTLPSEFSDFSLTLWWLDDTSWKLLQPYESSTQYWVARVDDSTGAIAVTITRPITLTSYRLRAVLVF